MDRLRIVILLATRGIFSHKVSSAIVAGIIAFGTCLLMLGTSLLDSIDRSMERSIVLADNRTVRFPNWLGSVGPSPREAAEGQGVAEEGRPASAPGPVPRRNPFGDRRLRVDGPTDASQLAIGAGSGPLGLFPARPGPSGPPRPPARAPGGTRP